MRSGHQTGKMLLSHGAAMKKVSNIEVVNIQQEKAMRTDKLKAKDSKKLEICQNSPKRT